jgi:hypothetical protein
MAGRARQAWAFGKDATDAKMAAVVDRALGEGRTSGL